MSLAGECILTNNYFDDKLFDIKVYNNYFETLKVKEHVCNYMDYIT
jgi:hypothetical protein